jgi:hypothetical protein
MKKPDDWVYMDKERLLHEATAELIDALERLYVALDGDEASVGEVAYECHKAARRVQREVGRACL